MQEEKIDRLTEQVKNFLSRESNVSKKINELEERVSKMNYSILENDIDRLSGGEFEESFENFIRKGISGDFITKSSLSGKNNEAGALISPTLSNRIISSINEKSPMRQLASVERISSRALDIIIEDGDFASGWVGEDEARRDTDAPALVKKTITAYEIFAQPKATQSLINDSEINVENWLVERLVDSFVKLENEAFINGDGNNKPSGILQDNKVKTVNGGNAVTIELLLELINSIDEGYLTNAHFLMNRGTLSAIQSLKDNTGRFIWQQSLTDPLKQTIFGVPVVISSNMPDVAEDNLAIAIGDFKSAYKIVDRSGIDLLRDPYTEKPFVRFYAVKRVGGGVVNPEAIKFAKFTA